MKNDLNELNSVLFDTLRGVKDGSVDDAKATSIAKISNSIISNAKTQLAAVKMVKGTVFKTEVFGEVASKAIGPGEDVFEMKLTYAKYLGYQNVAEAISKEGKIDFNNGFNDWVKDNG